MGKKEKIWVHLFVNLNTTLVEKIFQLHSFEWKNSHSNFPIFHRNEILFRSLNFKLKKNFVHSLTTDAHWLIRSKASNSYDHFGEQNIQSVIDSTDEIRMCCWCKCTKPLWLIWCIGSCSARRCNLRQKRSFHWLKKLISHLHVLVCYKNSIINIFVTYWNMFYRWRTN